MKKALVTFLVAMIATFAIAQNKTEMKPAAKPEGLKKTEIKATDLPKAASDYIAMNMKGYTIDKAFKIEDPKGEVTYNVTVIKGTEREHLKFDKNGVFQKKSEPKSGMAPAEKKPAEPVK
jgi:hypothetical protein